MGIILKSAEVNAVGSLDLRGTMGVSENSPVGFQSIRLSFEVETDADDTGLRLLLDMAVKYSVNIRTLEGRNLLTYEIMRK